MDSDALLRQGQAITANRPRALLGMTIVFVGLSAILGTTPGRAEQGRDLHVADAGTWGISYQGRLVSPATGESLADGSHSLTVQLYDALTDGTLLQRTSATITTADGVFSTILDFDPLHFDGRDLYLEFDIDGDTLAPRQPLTAAPYSIMASRADNATGDITPRSLSVGGSEVINASGQWVGDPTNLRGPPGPKGDPGERGPGGDVTLPFQRSQASAEVLFDITNTGPGLAASFRASEGSGVTLSVEKTGTGASAGRFFIGDSGSTHDVLIAESDGSGAGVHSWSAAGDGVKGISEGAGHGVYGRSETGTGVYGDSGSGFAMRADDNVVQSRASGGWVKAMVHYGGGSLIRCFRGDADAEPATANTCSDFSVVSGAATGNVAIQFPFTVSDRFVVVTPRWGGDDFVTAVFEFPAGDQVQVRTRRPGAATGPPAQLMDSAFMLVVY